MKPTPREILLKYWGYDRFREPQERIIHELLSGNDCLALLPTGGGKSICYQVPALITDGLCLVISPLIALMEDQAQQLRKRNIACAVIHSGMTHDQLDAALDNCLFGPVKFLFCSPERMKTELFRVRAARMKISMMAVDEAHCISEWGYDFRPTYLEIGSIRELHPNIPILALTASATEQVQSDIINRLGLRSPAVHRKSFARPNISFVVRNTENKEARLIQALGRVEGTAIVYVRTRKAALETASNLNRADIPATYYHGGLNFEERSRRQDEWMQGKVRVMVATNAFGMGIDKADVRMVIHTNLPESPEAYYQEAGRAGRDGQPSYALLLYQAADGEALSRRVESNHPDAAYLRHLYQCLANYYQLAEGAGEMTSSEFDSEEFARRFGLRQAEVRAGLSRLQESGLIQVDERY